MVYQIVLWQTKLYIPHPQELTIWYIIEDGESGDHSAMLSHNNFKTSIVTQWWLSVLVIKMANWEIYIFFSFMNVIESGCIED